MYNGVRTQFMGCVHSSRYLNSLWLVHICISCLGWFIDPNSEATSSQVVGFSTDGQHAISGTAIGLTLWTVSTGDVECSMSQSDISSAVFSPDGQFVVSASSDNTIRLWDMTTCSDDDFEMLVRTFSAFNGDVTAVAFHAGPNNTFVLKSILQ